MKPIKHHRAAAVLKHTQSKRLATSRRPATARCAWTAAGSPPLFPAPSTLTFLSRQRTKRLNAALLREITTAALAELGVTGWQLTFYFVGARKMATINQTHLAHPGPTDVITFDYSDAPTANPRRQLPSPSPCLLGDVFICVDVAVTQAREFRTTWQAEVIRYVIHALLHLCGHDDLAPAPRRRMKQIENRLVRQLATRHSFTALARR